MNSVTSALRSRAVAAIILAAVFVVVAPACGQAPAAGASVGEPKQDASSGSDPGGGPGSTAAATPRARLASASRLASDLEPKMGRPMTAAERDALRELGQVQRRDLQAIQTTFTAELSHVTALPAQEIAAVLPGISQADPESEKALITKLEARLRRALRPAELEQIGRAQAARKAAMQSVRDSFAMKAAERLGLKTADVLAVLPEGTFC